MPTVFEWRPYPGGAVIRHAQAHEIEIPAAVRDPAAILFYNQAGRPAGGHRSLGWPERSGVLVIERDSAISD